MSYVSLETFKQHLRNELGGVDDDELQEALDSADEAINAYCGRTFTATASATRVYIPSATDVIFIDDATSVTSVTADGSTLSASDYQLEPLNGIVNGQAVPYTRIRRLGSLWFPSTIGKATVSVVGSFGWSATPSRVLTAAKILAKEIAETRNQMGGYAQIGPDLAARAISHPKYRQMLHGLRRMDRVGGV